MDKSRAKTSIRAAVLALACTISAALADDPKDQPPPIDTNRPSFMASPLVLPRGSVQLENGFLFSGLRHGAWAADLPETEVRVGLLKHTELQMFVPDAFIARNIGGPVYGRATDLSEIGLKQQLPTLGRLTASVIAAVTVPSGSPAFSGTGTQAVVHVPYGISLNDRWALCGQQSVQVINSGRDVVYQPDVLINRSIGKRGSAFVEYGGTFIQQHNPTNIIHFGSIYKISHCQQIDMQFGFGLNESAPSAFVGAGIRCASTACTGRGQNRVYLGQILCWARQCPCLKR